MLDEYSEDFGINFDQNISENQKQQLKGNTQPYQSDMGMQAPYQQPMQQPFYQQTNPPDPRMQQYAQYQQPVMPQTPGYAAAASAPNGMRSRLDGVFSEESKDLKELLRAEQGEGCIKKIFFIVISVLVVIISFWASFILGKKIFLPETTNLRNEIPAFLTQKSGDSIKSTIDSVKNITQTDNLFKTIIPKSETEKVVPPEVRRLKVQTLPVKTYEEPERKTVAKVSASQPASQRPAKPAANTSLLYRVIAGSYPTKQQAEDAVRNLKIDGFSSFMYQANGEYRIQIGAFKSKSGATEYMQKVQEYGYNAFLSVK